jgi:Rrf2 family iron-sulfur cluster assembly transcriptional regulator
MMTVSILLGMESTFECGRVMQFTKAEAYGLFGVLYLAQQQPGKVTPLSEISEVQNVPEKFLAKIFQSLSKAGIIRSHRGVKGGFSLARPADEISFREVVEVIHGPYFLAKCFSVEEICDRRNCPVKVLLEKAQSKLMDLFEEHTIANLVEWEKEGKTAKATRNV